MGELNIHFYKGKEEVLGKIKGATEELTETEALQTIQDSFSKVLDGKNLSFLLGCGCSSYVVEKKDGSENREWNDVGIPTMVPLAKEFYQDVLSLDETNWLKDELNLDVEDDKFKRNLEYLLGTLHSQYYFLDSTGQVPKNASNKIDESDPSVPSIKLHAIIRKARNFLLEKCLNEANRKSKGDKELLELYKSFYRKLLYRNSNLQKPSIFTTNYDLYSETALDDLGIHYVNGFSGGIRKYFNPTIFNYALAEKMDLSQSKWSVIDNFIYLYKLHGSLNWIEDHEGSKLFDVREVQETSFEYLREQEVLMIHPTPLKQKTSMGSPYSDLFREFQKKLMQNNNVLITLGYSFSDEHVNNLIYQAFTIPSFRLIVLGDPKASKDIEKLQALDDPRIWIVSGTLDDDTKLHYFKGFVDRILPNLSNDEIDEKIENAVKTLFKQA